MTKVTVELELDETAYRAKYGPGSEYWNKYQVDRVLDGGQNQFGPTYHNVVKPASEYKPMEGQILHDAVIEILSEGFYDWASEGWMKLKIDGKAMRECCGTVEGDSHKSYCESIAGPEASEA
jgi:hypothetical protein